MLANGKVKVLCVVGTRPEVIKMAPVMLALRQTTWAHVVVVATAQHRGLLDQALADFGIVPDLDLDLMRQDQGLAKLTARLIERMDQILVEEVPDMVLAQGDTTTVLATGLCCFYKGVRFGHVEAGLRTFNRRLPFPEEMNRVFASYLASIHFAPTKLARQHLLSEGIPESAIHLTGNTVIDALQFQVSRTENLELPLDQGLRTVLVTVHRRESFGKPMADICDAIIALVAQHPDIQVLLPKHPNPSAGEFLNSRLQGRERIVLVDPMDYPHFVSAMQRSHLVLTDSGGVQEEAPALGKPVLVLRSETERPEAITAGVAMLVGSGCEGIVRETSRLLSDAAAYAAMAKGASPYGDGRAAERIVRALARDFGKLA